MTVCEESGMIMTLPFTVNEVSTELIRMQTQEYNAENERQLYERNYFPLLATFSQTDFGFL